MELYFENKIKKLAEILRVPLYAVGGYVRDFLIGKELSFDIDLCSEMSAEELIPFLRKVGLKPVAEYKKTGTVVFFGEKAKYEYTAWRKEEYDAGGKHTPIKVWGTDDIKEDALRRDFKCNAVYYDVKKGEYVDPLGGITDIENKVLDTVDLPEKVFSHDGLRLLRGARFSGELGFTLFPKVKKAMKDNADNIKEIVPERIFDELKRILVADCAHGFSDKNGHYTALKILDETRVLDRIIPELTLGRGMKQRKDFHKFDVLTHSLKCVLYAHKKVRLAGLLHDIGKPFCMETFGKYHNHATEGKRIAGEVLKRLKADGKTVSEIKRLVELHMFGIKRKDVSEEELKLFIVENADILEDLLLLKQADFTAGKEEKGVCESVERIRKTFEQMKENGTPFSLKELALKGDDVKNLGFSGREINEKLNELFRTAVLNPKLNNKEILLGILKKNF